MTDYKPGTVAVATVRGERQRVMYVGWPSGHGWVSESGQSGPMGSDDSLTDIRPLVVLDIGDFPHAQHQIATALRLLLSDTERGGWEIRALRAVADQIEVQTKPPRIPEPGWGAIVEAGSLNRFPWTRFSNSESCDEGDWINRDGRRCQWNDLIDPVLIREGVDG